MHSTRNIAHRTITEINEEEQNKKRKLVSRKDLVSVIVCEDKPDKLL